MKLKFIIVIILLCIMGKLFSQDIHDLMITGNFRNLSFQEFSSQMESNYPLKFFYKNEWVQSVEVNIEADGISFKKLMDQVLLHSLLGYVIDIEGNVYLLPNKSIASELPEYTEGNELLSENLKDTAQLIIEEKYLKAREPDMIETIVIGESDQGQRNKPAIINGKLVDEGTGEPLIGATIYIAELKLGAVTDQYGSMSLALKPGKYSASFQCMGMAGVKCILDVKSKGYFSLRMKPELISLAEVTVRADKTQSRGSATGLEIVNIQAIKEMPSLMGEKDVMKIAQLLPGVVSVGEGASGANVRGGSVDQNLFYLDEIPLYNMSHLFGFFSAINTNIINNFSIYKGQVPASYGGRLSSVFNVETRKGNKNNFFAQGGVSPISAQTSAEFPVIRNKASVILSARSSYSDWILNQMNDPALRNSDARFYDLALGVDYELDPKNHLNFFVYNSNDFFNLNEIIDYGYSNAAGSLNYLHRFSPGLKLQLTVINSNYKFNTTDKGSISSAYEHQYRLKHQELKSSVNWLLSEKHNISGGVSSILYTLERGDVKPFGPESRRETISLGTEKGVESALFLGDTYTPAYWLSLYAGLRYSIYNEIGPKKVLSYFPDTPKNENTINNSVEYGSGEIISTYHGPELRLSADFKINYNNSIKLSFTQMQQFLFMLSNTVAVAPNDQWKLADSHLVPPRSNQYSIGYFLNLAGSGISTSVEGYVKEATNIVEYGDGTDFLATPYVETNTLQGNQSAYGIEFMLAKNKGKLNGWISYAFSRSMITVDGENLWEQINDGDTYPANYDKPHALNLVANYKVNRRISFSSTVTYSTGRPITLPQSVIYVEDTPYVEYSERNAYRIPDYLRTDLSMTMEGNLKRDKFLHSYWVFSVYNMMGRKNAYSVYFVSDQNRIKGYQFSVIGIPVFTITWNFKLGNYASN